MRSGSSSGIKAPQGISARLHRRLRNIHQREKPDLHLPRIAIALGYRWQPSLSVISRGTRHRRVGLSPDLVIKALLVMWRIAAGICRCVSGAGPDAIIPSPPSSPTRSDRRVCLPRLVSISRHRRRSMPSSPPHPKRLKGSIRRSLHEFVPNSTRIPALKLRDQNRL